MDKQMRMVRKELNKIIASIGTTHDSIKTYGPGYNGTSIRAELREIYLKIQGVTKMIDMAEVK